VRVPDRFRVGIARYQPGTDDPDELAAWWLETFGAVWLDGERNAWLYEQNPCIGDDGPGPWLCRRDGRIVGQQGEVPFDLQVGSTLRRAVWAVDLSVDEAWRLRGVGPALIATLLEHNSIACMLDLSDEGYAAFLGAGCVDLGSLPVYRRPLDPRRALQMAGVPATVRRLGPVAVPALRLADALTGALLRLAGARLVPVERFDHRVDDVWAAVHEAYPVLARRDLAALAWRIDERPDRDRLQRYYLVRRGRTIGYVVLRPTVSSGEPAVVVVDYLAPPRWVTPMLLLAGRVARRAGAVALSVKTRNPRADRALRTTGFVRRRLDHDQERRIMVHCAEAPEVAAVLHDPDAWFFTSTDSNLEHAGADPVPSQPGH
jgi:GNAT superfamily N-acetyltransferase